jgi:signal transduction histidine kinase/ActR/RegA family two-component response regulator
MRQFNLFRSFWIVPGLTILAILVVGGAWSYLSSKDYLTNLADHLRQDAQVLGLPLQSLVQTGLKPTAEARDQLRQALMGSSPNLALHYDVYDQKGAYLLSLPQDRPDPIQAVPSSILLEWVKDDQGLLEIPGPVPGQNLLAQIWAPSDQSVIILASQPLAQVEEQLTQLRLRHLILILCLVSLILVISFWAQSFISRLEEELAKSQTLRQGKGSAPSDIKAVNNRTQFLAMMSHELRTPLTSVVGFARLLSKQEMSQEATHYLRLIDEASAQLMKIIDDILDFSKLDSGQMQRTYSLLVLQPFLTSLKDVASLFIGSKNVAMRLTLDPSLPASVYVDSSKLRQIVQIFLTNAAKFTTQGEIHLHASYVAPNLILSVQDSGTGIPESKLQSLFEPFQQADHDQALRDRGTGLGLAIAKRLADLLNGSIAISSRYGSGTKIELTLPVTTPLSENTKQEDPAQLTQEPRDLLRILIADDSSSSRLLLQIILSKRGHQVEAVDNGEDALEATQTARFDLVILDMQMPRMGGLECARAIRALPKQKHPSRLIALTAQSFDEDKQAAAEAGFDAFISKPYSEEQIEALLRSVPTQQS